MSDFLRLHLLHSPKRDFFKYILWQPSSTVSFIEHEVAWAPAQLRARIVLSATCYGVYPPKLCSLPDTPNEQSVLFHTPKLCNVFS